MNKIPSHDFYGDTQQGVRVVELTQLTHYDTSTPHRHRYFELFFFEVGAGVHEIDFQTYSIESGHIHLVAPGQVHRVRRELNTNGYVILFDPELFAHQSNIYNFLFDHSCFSADEMYPIYHFADSIPVLREEISQIWKEYKSDSPFKDAIVQQRLAILLLKCMEIKGVSQFSNLEIGLYSKFRRAVKHHFKQKKKVKEYAELLHTTEKALNESTSKKCGLSPSQIIYNELILEAKRLLNAGNAVKEVAFSLLFDDPAHFSKFFKAQTGISPAQFVETAP